MLRVRVLGPMEVALDDTVLTPPSSRRAWGLLAWLALNPGSHPRGALAARFWPDVLDASARASLRSAVWTLRRTLGDSAGDCLLATRDQVGLDGAAWVDAHAFDEHVAAGRLEAAVELCDAGELLAGFEEEWALQARDAHRERLLGVLERLAAAADARGDATAALDWTRRQVALDAFGEEAHRGLMVRLAAAGERTAALATYRRLADRLARELSVAPSAATRELAASLRAEDPAGAAEPAARSAEPATPAAAGAPPTADAAPALRPPPRHLPLHGRGAELDELLGAWEQARAGHGAAAVLSGEAGIGKTRLATELRERAAAAGARTATCAALELGGGPPFGLWAELARELARDLPAPPAAARWPEDLGQLVPDVVQRMGRDPAPRLEAPPELERARLFEAAAELVAWAAHDRPLVLALEDLHAADAPSLELIGYVGRRLPALPVLLVLTRRELPRRAEVDALEHGLRVRGALTHELTLTALPADVLEALVRELGPLPDADVARAVGAAEGNPLLALATSRAIARGEGALPASLRGAMRAALAPLPADARLAAELAAVAGRALERGELERLPFEHPAEAASAAIETGVLIGEGGRFGFRHALLRDAVYADLPDPHRAWLHEQLAGALDGDDDALAAETAHHLRRAGRDERAAAALIRAAAHARRVAALAEAAGFLREALTLASPTPELLIELADLEAWQGRRAAAEETFAQAIALIDPDDALALARAHLRAARWYHGPICVPREVERSAVRALELLDTLADPPRRERSDALANRAWAQAVTGEVEVAEALLAELHALVGRGPVDDELTYDIAHARAQALIRRGRFEESYAPATAAGEASERSGRAELAYGCWMNAAGAATAAGDFPRALEFIDRCAIQLRRAGLQVLELPMLAARAFVLTRTGDLDAARATLADQQALADRLGEPSLLSATAYDHGMFALVESDHERAAELLARALEHEAPISRPLARLARAEALARCGHCEEAEREVRETALETVGPADFPDTLVPRMARVQGLIALARGDLPLADRRLAEAEAGWRRRRDQTRAGDGMAAVLADFGRPVLGIVEPDVELERVRADRAALAPLLTHEPQGA